MTTTVRFTVELKHGDAPKEFVVTVHEDWAPIGAQRFLDLVKDANFDGGGFYRVVPGFMAQFGIAATAEKYQKWSKMINDDPVTEKNTRGKMSFAMRGPDTRSCQVFINFGDNSNLDSQGFSPFAEVTQGMEVVDQLCSKYEDAPYREPVKERGSSFDHLGSKYPELSYVLKAEII
eukprot:TRINITY_DN49762_c0_g1_i1.p1 TRINITY_DN49762_c0_g1~~TRINITY_DN49762_c0_g1_i1.p1  ORF type:complete len:176 (+),score=33.63 TRINITY_DN49762_c0_g1_i1:63-590(+)